MTLSKVVIAIVLIQLHFSNITGHGMLMDPINRSSAWRKGFNNSRNDDDNGINCGGFQVQYEQNQGKCGVCGDDFALPQPRNNEYGGFYSLNGVPVREYIAGQVITATVTITAAHNGYFVFSLCPLESPSDIETEECFRRHPVLTIDGQKQWQIPIDEPETFEIQLLLPENLVCERCTFRWHWRTGNNWGWCNDDDENNRGDLGCGAQEIFRTCSDIKIVAQ